MATYSKSSFTESYLKQMFSEIKDTKYSWCNIYSRPPFSAMKKAAVLIPLFLKDGEIHIWLTKRAKHLRNDPGHVAFPGGMKDETDEDEVHTCLRESEEEIGLKPHDANIIGHLLPRVNGRLILITPVVAIVNPNFQPKVNKEEVDTAFSLPLARFLSNERHTLGEYTIRSTKLILHHFIDFINGEEMDTFGLTGSLCLETAIYLFKREPDFPWKPVRIKDNKPLEVQVENPFYHQQLFLDEYESVHRNNASHL